MRGKSIVYIIFVSKKIAEDFFQIFEMNLNKQRA